MEKERHGFVTFYLWLIIIGSSIVAYLSFTRNEFLLALYGYNYQLVLVSGFVGIAYTIAAILLLNWINGFWLYLVFAILSLFITGPSMNSWFFALISSGIACLTLFGVLHLKGNGISAWAHLTNKNKKKPEVHGNVVGQIEKVPLIEKDWKAVFAENNLEDYIRVFKENKLTSASIISELNESDLEKLGISIMGDRKNILKLFSAENLYKNTSEKEDIGSTPLGTGVKVGNLYKVIKEAVLVDSIGLKAETKRKLKVGEKIKLNSVLESFGEHWAHVETEALEEGWCVLWALDKQ